MLSAARHCWLCGMALRITPGGGPSYCDACEAFTGEGIPYDRDRSYPWRCADGRQVAERYVDHSVVHQPSPA